MQVVFALNNFASYAFFLDVTSVFAMIIYCIP